MGFAQSGLVNLTLDLIQQQENRDRWVDSTFNRLTEEERIAQLFMVAAYSNRDDSHKDEISRLIKDYKIGGLIFFQGTPTRQAELTNHYQSLSKAPLLISMDLEWGLGMRLDSTLSFPRQLTLGANPDSKLIYEMGKEIARQCKRLGVHINFAPVVDVNNNPNNPVINDRSFGEDKLNVALKGLAYMEGMQEAGIVACAKHFPGHGDTDKDSHLTLPVINHSRDRLDNIELYPFKVLIANEVKSVMSAHIHIPALDSTPKLAASLSKKITTNLLRDEIGFTGLVFSDALNMKGVSNFYAPGEVDLAAFLAGNDILLYAEDVRTAIRLFKHAIKDGRIEKDDLSQRVKKILTTKYEVGLADYKPIELQGLTKDLNTPAAKLLQQQLFENALTVVQNKNGLIPLMSLDTLKIASLSIGGESENYFKVSLENYSPVTHFHTGKNTSLTQYQNLLAQISKYNTVIIGLHDMSKYASKNYGLSRETLSFLKDISRVTHAILVVFGSPYSLKFIEDINWLIVAYEDNPITQGLAAQLIFGGITSQGVLPVTASEKYYYGMGISTVPGFRLKYTFPEEVGINSAYLNEIDNIAVNAIADKATPGCQILVAKEGKVIYNKSFGYHTYDSIRIVKNTDLYDLASITKIAGTTISLMNLYDQRQFQLNRKISDYIPGLIKSTIKNTIVKDILTHQAGLRSWIPFYLTTIHDSVYNKIYHTENVGAYNVKVANNLYMRNDYRDKIFDEIFNSELNPRPKYQYSDLGFYLLPVIIESLTKMPFDKFLEDTFFAPLGLGTMTFNPGNKFSEERLVPTENDKTFRKQLVQGYVHDPGAAMLGGISGHAGLFSNANDLAIIMQMLLNRGAYGGVRFISPMTVSMFTKRDNNESRRGLGFDKPEIDIYKPQPTAKDASPRTFGHSGFTGTCMWADPDNELVFIFLSNRVNPSAENAKLIKNNVRTDIHQAIYNAIKKSADDRLAASTSKN